MAQINRYFLSKLCEINYRMSVHEGDANRRLASEAENIVLFPAADVPMRFRKSFEEMKKTLNDALADVRFPFTLSKIQSIRNSTAAKYLKLLIDIQDSLSGDLDSR